MILMVDTQELSYFIAHAIEKSSILWDSRISDSSFKNLYVNKYSGHRTLSEDDCVIRSARDLNDLVELLHASEVME